MKEIIIITIIITASIITAYILGRRHGKAEGISEGIEEGIRVASEYYEEEMNRIEGERLQPPDEEAS